MLNSGMQEASADEMEITGYAVEAVRAFVRFLYSDSCSRAALQQYAWDLLAMADQYDVPALRFVCETYIAEYMQQENAVIALQRADTHNTPVLKRKALDHNAQNKKAVTENLAAVRELSAELMVELMMRLAK
jgi:phage FluMu gp28-like protein